MRQDGNTTGFRPDTLQHGTLKRPKSTIKISYAGKGFRAGLDVTRQIFPRAEVKTRKSLATPISGNVFPPVPHAKREISFLCVQLVRRVEIAANTCFVR
ncbi:hypothetical protein EVAR_61167_1 [Eumeta japonica]|uniref:Uncharacterized protein n=1 Tax=Eumeta variegata TaxID=151549 RepID=A0A4C1ZSB9_EUMVA|nr:hypothetical protein EVAR_61167_1 [Eumeta japonica]